VIINKALKAEKRVINAVMKVWLVFFILAVFVRNYQVIVPIFHFYLVFVCGYVAFFSRVKSNRLLAFFSSIIILLLFFLLKIYLDIGVISFASLNMILFFIIIPTVIFYSFGKLKYLIFSDFFNKSVFYFCLLGLLGYFYLIVTIEHFEAKALWYELGSALGRRGMINNIISFGFYEDFLVRYNGFALDPNRWCYCLLLFYIIVDFNRDSKLSTLCKTLVGFSILLTFSRAGIGLWISYLFISNIVYGKYYRVILIPIITLLAILILLNYFGVLDLAFARLTYGITGDTGDSARGAIWSSYIHEISMGGVVMFFGVGTDMDPASNMGITPHNAVLYLAYQLGFFVSSLYILIMVVSILFIVRSKSKRLLNLNVGVSLLFFMTLTEDYIALPFFWLVPCLLFSQKYLRSLTYKKIAVLPAKV
jgi:hypothetical protein